MSSQQIDYAALAEQARQESAPKVDYAALAEQARSQNAPKAQPKSIWERMGIVPDSDAAPPPLKDGEQAGPNTEGSPGELLTEGLKNFSKDAAKYYAEKGPGEVAGGIDDIAKGNIAKGGHRLISGGSTTLLPLAPEAIAANPVMALRAVGGGVVGGNLAEAGTKAVGGNEDQQKLASDLGNLAGGGIAATGAIRAFLGSPTKALLSKVAGAADGVISDDLLGTISPRALHSLRMLRAAAKVAGASEDSAGLAEIAAKHADAIGTKEQELNDALSKANALPPEGPTAKITDVPDLRVQPGKQPPQNLLAEPAAPTAQPQPQDGAFQVVPPEGAIQESKLPDMEIYKEPMLPPKPLKPPTLLEQLKQWDQIRQIHSQLEDQIGKGQDELQQWMEDHNQKAPGAKPKSVTETARARFEAARAKAEGVTKSGDEGQGALESPRVPTSDADLENLLMKSVQAAKAKRSAAAAGD